jgi:cytochrome c556
MTRSGVLTGLALIAGVAVAASGIAVGQDVIAQRKELMKGVGGAAKASTQMVKGEKPYDAKEAETAMTTIAKNWATFVKLFPENSKAGGETTAAPKIWESMNDFSAKGDKLAADATAAATVAGKGPDAFKAAFGEVVKNCKGCHELYRIPKK